MESFIGRAVEFQTDFCSWGRGVVVGVNHMTGQVRVQDEEDGDVWFGSEDKIRFID